jgi:hypothetical protein
VLYYFSHDLKKRMLKLIKYSTITVSVFKSVDKLSTSFEIKYDNDVVGQVSYIIEDTLKSY